jgi:hypothetical protein
MNKAFKKKVKTYSMVNMMVESTKFVGRGSTLMLGEELINVIRIIDDNNLIAGKRIR